MSVDPSLFSSDKFPTILRQGGARLKTQLAMTIVVVSALIAGCAVSLGMLMNPGSARPPMQFVMMSRDAGYVYHGVEHANRSGSCTITVNVDSRIYTGPLRKSGSTLLLSADNHELRCDMQGYGMGNGVGTCVDDSGRLYDAALRK